MTVLKEIASAAIYWGPERVNGSNFIIQKRRYHANLKIKQLIPTTTFKALKQLPILYE